MTVENYISGIDYTGDGLTKTYDFPFRITSDTHIRVIVRDLEDVETVLALNVDYSVSGVLADNGGSITLINAFQEWLDDEGDLKEDYTITLVRGMPLSQPTTIRSNDRINLAAIENQMDAMTYMLHQLQEQLDRSVHLPESEAGSPDTVTLPPFSQRPNSFFAWDVNGKPMASAGGISGSLPVSAFIQTLIDDANAAAARATLGLNGAGGVLQTGDYANDSVAFSKLANMVASRLLGRGSAGGTGDPQELTVGGGIEISATVLQLINAGVNFAKIQNIATARLLGRTTGSSGVIEELTAGAGLLLAAGALAADIASQANMEAETSGKLVSASVQKFHPSAAKAWALITYSGGVPSVAASYNVTSVTDVGTGDLTLNFTTPFSTANYSRCMSARRAGSDSALIAAVKQGTAPTASALAIQTLTVAPALEDAAEVDVQCFGDL